jgi:signal transduction histidine kinase
MFVLAQKIGAYMHGPLRSQFLQLSMALRLALENADPFEVATVLSKLREVAAGVEQRAETVPDLREFLDNWRALITIDSNLEEVHIPDQIRSKVTTVVTEAVNNAIRHGHAKQVGVFFRYRPEGLLVEVIGAPTDNDDGGEAGLGAHILNDIAPGMWLSDVTEDGRYRLRVTIKSTG